MHVRVCPECGSEYQPHVTVCLDCGGATEDRFLSESGASDDPIIPFERRPPFGDLEEGPAPAPPWSGESFHLRRAEGSWIETLTAALSAQGIPSHVQLVPEDRMGHSVDLFVRPEDLDAARAIDQQVFVAGIAEGDPVPVELKPGTCPACGSALPPNAQECPDCGLAVWESDPEPEATSEAE